MVAEDVRDKAIDYLTLNGASRISLFGSFVSGTAGPESENCPSSWESRWTC
jgi:predicted nucleotidyltransferase